MLCIITSSLSTRWVGPSRFKKNLYRRGPYFDTDINENVDLAARYSSTGKASTVKLAWAMKFLKMPSSFHLSPSLNTLFKMYDRVALKVDKCRFPEDVPVSEEHC